MPIQVEKERWFRGPVPKFAKVDSETPEINRGLNLIGGQYGDLLSKMLSRPQTGVEELLRTGQVGSEKIFDIGGESPLDLKKSPYLTGTGDFLSGLLPGLTEGARTGFRTDVSGIYKTARENALRGLTEYGIPQIKESLGRRGLRYGSNIADTIARTSGDIESGLAAKGAEAEAAASEAAAGRRLGAGQVGTGVSNVLSQIAAMVQSIDESNLNRRLREIARFQPDTYFPAAQQYLHTRPVYPPIVTGGVAFQPPKTLDDYLNSIMGLVGAGAGAYGAAGGAAAI